MTLQQHLYVLFQPVSSWAAAVSSSLPEDTTLDGFVMFLKSIPVLTTMPIFTIIMLLMLIILNFDFSKMKEYELKYGSSITGTKAEVEDEIQSGERGKVCDLIIPILAHRSILYRALCFILAGILEGNGIINSCKLRTHLSLVIGSFFTMIVIAHFILPRKVITFKQFAESLPEGFKAMVPAILILTFAWTLSGVCGDEYLQIGTYVKGVINNSSLPHAIIPGIFFLVSLFLGFSTGTSWGTFAILLPIVCAIFNSEATNIMILSMSSVMAGAVCGDHISPISDTTILSSTGAQCSHIEHVNTQIPYALLVAGISFVCYLVGGFTGNGYIGLVLGVLATPVILFGLYKKHREV